MAFAQTFVTFSAAAFATLVPLPVSAQPTCQQPIVTSLIAGLGGGSGSAIGPGGALYVTEPTTGRISRIDPNTGARSTFASGLPPRIAPIGGAMDIAFIGSTAYVLLTLVGPDVGGDDVVGIYRVDGPTSFTAIADIGEFALQNPPNTAFDVPTGVQYALETYRGGFLVTDGHHNRVLHVTRDGEISEWLPFANIVPTGLDISGNTVFMAQAGPVPHDPEDGKIVAINATSRAVTEIGAGARLLVDVEFGLGRQLYGLAQGQFPVDDPAGAPAAPNTGSLVQLKADGTFATIVTGLDRPTSVEFIGNTAYVTTLTGSIWKIENVSCPLAAQGTDTLASP